jgi:hypothetical protein
MLFRLIFCSLIGFSSYSQKTQIIENKVNNFIKDAKTYIKEDNIIAANQTYEYAMLFLKNKPYNQLKIKVLNGWGTLLTNNNENKIGFEKFSEANLLINKKTDSLLIGRIKLNLGNAYFKLGDSINAKKYHRIANFILKKDTTSLHSGYMWMNIGTKYFMQGKDSANYYLKNAEKIALKHNDYAFTTNTYLNLANDFYYTNQPDSAIINYKKAIKYAKLTNNELTLNGVLSRYYGFLIFLDHHNYAFDSIKALAKKTKKLKHWKPYLVIQSQLHQYYKQKGNYKKALNHSNLMYFANNQLSKSKYKKHTTSYKNYIEDIQLSLQAKKQVIHKKNNQLLIYTIVGILIIFVSLLLLLLYRKQTAYLKALKEKIALKNNETVLIKELVSKNKKLLTESIKLTENNKALEKTIQSLKKIQKQPNKNLNAEIIAILSDLKQRENAINWKEFELRFDKLNPNFYANLFNDFPNLTTNDKRLAAFIKLNLTTKEISNITKQSTNSIDVAKTRLRKKVNLNSKIDLYQVFKKY